MLKKVENESSFAGHNLTGTDSSFKAGRRQLLELLDASFENRFGDLEDSLLNATKIVDFKHWPEKEHKKGKL